MIVNATWFKESGKYYTHGEADVGDAKAFDSAEVLKAIVLNQQVMAENWWKAGEFYLVVDDLPESMADRNYNVTFCRLYSPQRILEIMRAR